MTIRESIARVEHLLAHHSGYSTRRARAVSGGRIFTYHAVGVPSCTAEVFEAQVRYLKKHFQLTSLGEFVARLKSDPGSLDRRIALTFDDGLRNNLTVAQPILQRHRAPATFFVCPGLIDAGRWLWNIEARCRLRSLPPGRLREVADRLGHPGASPDQIVEWMKTLPPPSRRHVEEVVRIESPAFHPGAAQRVENDLMNWDEIAQLDPEWITIGGHSTNHPILGQCEPGELEEEIGGCRRRLEERIQRPVELFCYPNGDFNEAVVRHAERAYAAAVTTRQGFVRADAKPHQLPRIGSTRTLPYLSWRLHRPWS